MKEVSVLCEKICTGILSVWADAGLAEKFMEIEGIVWAHADHDVHYDIHFDPRYNADDIQAEVARIATEASNEHR